MRVLILNGSTEGVWSVFEVKERTYAARMQNKCRNIAETIEDVLTVDTT